MHTTLNAAEEPTLPPPRSLVPAMRASLYAKLERLLARPLVARLADASSPPSDSDARACPDAFLALASAVATATPASKPVWHVDAKDGTCRVRVEIDYDDLWRGCEREVLDTLGAAIEEQVVFLTEAQQRLLTRSPREYLALSPRPESLELVEYESARIGGSTRVVALRVASSPEGRQHLRYVAVVPNLVQLERCLAALDVLVRAGDDSRLAPLRALVGLCDAAKLSVTPSVTPDAPFPSRLDEHQVQCVRRAMETPHFAVIQGPPGSGKTTVIHEIVHRALARGERVLVVSPTHVAVDNVVEKLVPQEQAADDRLDPTSLPVRFAAKRSKLSKGAERYWVGRGGQVRAATLAKRVEHRLRATIPFADALFEREGGKATRECPLSSVLSAVQRVLCGTPMGLLSYDPVKNAQPGDFDLLVVDEVSKMTLPDFLAVAVKARRWVLVGDPQQLPPFSNAEEGGVTLDDLMSPALELVCSVGTLVERCRPHERPNLRLLVVARDPVGARASIEAHLAAVGLQNAPAVRHLDASVAAGIVVCAPADVAQAFVVLPPMSSQDRGRSPAATGSVSVLVERGVSVARPEFASGARLVEARLRAHAAVFETAFNVYHTQPWATEARQRLESVAFRNGIDKSLPSEAALVATEGVAVEAAAAARAARVVAIAERFAVNAVSVYDWLAGMPTGQFDTSPLRELARFEPSGLQRAVSPYVATLARQYRMHPSLSRVPRGLFYFERALLDGLAVRDASCRVQLVQVAGVRGDEWHEPEADTVCDMLRGLDANDACRTKRPEVMVITPYRAQEALLVERIEAQREAGQLRHVDVSVCTLDRCQGREAEYVIISLVRDRATAFLDSPKRWNVALTRAREGLFLVGDLQAYLDEAARARREQRRREDGRVRLSVIARIVEAYQTQIQSVQEHREAC
jgi:hypothetical protein